MKKSLLDIADYCRQNISNYDDRLNIALVKMDYQKLPLSQADRNLYDEMEEQITDYFDENEISYEFDDNFDEIIDSLIYM